MDSWTHKYVKFEHEDADRQSRVPRSSQGPFIERVLDKYGAGMGIGEHVG